MAYTSSKSKEEIHLAVLKLLCAHLCQQSRRNLFIKSLELNKTTPAEQKAVFDKFISFLEQGRWWSAWGVIAVAEWRDEFHEREDVNRQVLRQSLVSVQAAVLCHLAAAAAASLACNLVIVMEQPARWTDLELDTLLGQKDDEQPTLHLILYCMWDEFVVGATRPAPGQPAGQTSAKAPRVLGLRCSLLF